MNRLPTHDQVRPLVPPEPLLSPAELTFRSGSFGTRAIPRFDFFWARNAIFHGLRALGLQAGHRVLLPAYLCAAAIEPIDHLGAQVQFYAIRRSCEPDWLDLETKIRAGARAVLAVHYFGFPGDMERFRALCDEHNLLLVEDCAHVLEGVPNPHRFGEVGDFSVFSPRKHLPIFDGGTLRFNRPVPGFHVRFRAESALFTLREAKNLFERRKPPALMPVLSAGAHAENAEKKRELDFDRRLPEKPRYVFPNSTSFLPWMADFPMSRLSRHLLPRFPLAQIASKRRANYCCLLEKLSKVNGVQVLFGRLEPGVVPWVFPLTIEERRDAHTALRALGIPAVTWSDVRDPRISAKEFPDADWLYEHLIFLPIHQDLDSAQMDLIAGAVATVARTGRDFLSP